MRDTSLRAACQPHQEIGGSVDEAESVGFQDSRITRWGKKISVGQGSGRDAQDGEVGFPFRRRIIGDVLEELRAKHGQSQVDGWCAAGAALNDDEATSLAFWVSDLLSTAAARMMRRGGRTEQNEVCFGKRHARPLMEMCDVRNGSTAP